MFDLSQFEKTPIFAPDNQIGVVLSLPLTAVIEDPTQPRTEFDEDELLKLAEDIGRRGVQAPIAVRPPVDGVYRIIHGARRFRASTKAGLATIPAIVQEDEVAFDDYSQVLENTQRDSLSPMDIARFIQKRKALGESNSQIARNLSEKPEWVTYHLALIELPDDIQKAFDAGQVKGAKTTYELRKLHGKDPEKAKKLVDSGQEITQVRIREVMSVPKIELSEKPEMTKADVLPAAVHSTGAESEANVVQTGNEVSPSPESLTSPRVIGIYQRNPVQVLVHLRPTEPGFVWIHVSGTPGKQEVLADQITLSRIEEKHP
ncbi:MAG: ParB/RepB/Spo0J family partition protein [Fluviibacter sp.]